MSLVVACRPASRFSLSGTDCGTTEESTPPAYSASARECFWSAYSSGGAAFWNARGVTTEGDPIPSLLSFDPARGLDVTRDVTARQVLYPVGSSGLVVALQHIDEANLGDGRVALLL
jgi:hypothetical protein